MDFIQILYQTHVQATIHRPCKHIEVNIDTVVLPKSKEEFDIHCQNAYKKFQQSEESKLYGRGSVDINPEIWAQICYSKVLDAIKESEKTVKLPNGCCVK